MRVADSNAAYKNQRRLAEQNRLNKAKIEKEKKDFDTKFEKLQNTNTKNLDEIKADYTEKYNFEVNNLAKKLNRLRKSQKQQLHMENTGAAKEMHNLKASHAMQVSEVKRSQQLQLKEMHDEHKEVLDNARIKFEREFAKYQV